MAMISKNAKQPLEGKASAATPFTAAEGAMKTGTGSDGGAWAADMRAPLLTVISVQATIFLVKKRNGWISHRS